MRKRVAVVLPYFGEGGSEKMVAHLVSGLNHDEFMVRVFCIYGEPQNNRSEEEVRESGVHICWIGKPLGFSLRAVYRLGKELTRFSPDLVHTHLAAIMYASPWAIACHCPMIHTMHTVPSFENRNMIRRFISSFMFRSGRAVPVAISDQIRKLTAEYYSIPIEKVELAYNPVEVSKYYHRAEKSDQKIRFINVGRLCVPKDQELLLRAFRKLLDQGVSAELQIVGSGELETELKRTVHMLGLTNAVDFTGQVDHVEDYLANADVFVLSSETEGLPLSVLEAMAAGLPIIATDVGGLKDIVTDNGILVPSKNADALSSAMQYLALNKNVRIEYAAKSKDHSSRYDISETVYQYTRIYHNCARA